MSAISRRSPAPLYAQVETALMDRVRKDYSPGALLPPQRRLAEEFGTSLITVRRAVDELARKGFLRTTRGLGTVVLHPPIRDDRQGLSSWTDAMTGLGRMPRTVRSRTRTRVPPVAVARALRLKARERTVVLERQRTLDGEPICLMRNELPLSLAPALAGEGLAEESLYAWLRRRHRLVPHHAEEEVEARRSDRDEYRFLRERIVLVVHRRTYLAGGRPLEIAEMIAPAGRYRYRIKIHRT